MELRGYLTTGKFAVNDYAIEIERVEDGVRLRVTDGSGKVQEAVVKDGQPEISNEDSITMREMFDSLLQAYPEWQDNEQARRNAERVRDSAETARNTLYQQMKALYESMPDSERNLQKIEEAVTRAEAARDYAQTAATAAVNNLISQLFYQPGEMITIGDSGTAQSTSLNASGYCTGGRKQINLKIPVAKRLDRISTVECNSFIAHIVNSGGYGLGNSDQEGGYDFTGNIVSCYADKAQGCIHINMHKDAGFNLNANECVSARIGSNRRGVPAVTFTLR